MAPMPVAQRKEVVDSYARTGRNRETARIASVRVGRPISEGAVRYQANKLSTLMPTLCKQVFSSSHSVAMAKRREECAHKGGNSIDLRVSPTRQIDNLI